MIDISERDNESWIRTALDLLGPIGMPEKTTKIIDEETEAVFDE